MQERNPVLGRYIPRMRAGLFDWRDDNRALAPIHFAYGGTNVST